MGHLTTFVFLVTRKCCHYKLDRQITLNIFICLFYNHILLSPIKWLYLTHVRTTGPLITSTPLAPYNANVPISQSSLAAALFMLCMSDDSIAAFDPDSLINLIMCLVDVSVQ